MKNITSILLVAGILLLANFLSERFFFRFDLTEDNQYTLSQATKNILKDLAEQGQPVTVTAYFSDDLPADIAKGKRDFREMLVEFSNLSKGYLDYEFVTPESEEEKNQALTAGIQPVMINIREKDEMKAQQAFLGAVIKLGDQQETIPLIQPDMPLEYALATAIKKISVVDKPSIGIIQGHGEPELSELSQAYEQLSILYNVETIDLSATERIEDRFKSIAIIRPTDSVPPAQFDILDDYLSRGGDIFIAINAVEGDLQQQSGSPVSTGFGSWLQGKGVEVEQSFVVDARCGRVNVQQQQGFFTIQTPVQFPYLPLISDFADHPVTKGLEQIIFPFASPVRSLGDPGKTFTSLAFTSDKSGIIQPPVFFDITEKKWTESDLPLSAVSVAGVLEGKLVGDMKSRIVVVGDGDFCVSGRQGANPDNVSFMTNSIDWLSDETGLIELRTKGVVSRPIDTLEDGTRNMLKYLNFLLPILLVIIYGIFRSQRQKTLRMKRMSERYA